MASQIQLAFYWISNCANCQSGNRAGCLAGYWLVCEYRTTAATRTHRCVYATRVCCRAERTIALPPNRYFYTNSDNRPCTTSSVLLEYRGNNRWLFKCLQLVLRSSRKLPSIVRLFTMKSFRRQKSSVLTIRDVSYKLQVRK